LYGFATNTEYISKRRTLCLQTSSHLDTHFNIVSRNSDCLLKLKTRLDYESARNHTIRLRIPPGKQASGRGTTLTVSIDVLDADDMGVEFDASEYTCNMTENLTVCVILIYCALHFGNTVEDRFFNSFYI